MWHLFGKLDFRLFNSYLLAQSLLNDGSSRLVSSCLRKCTFDCQLER